MVFRDARGSPQGFAERLCCIDARWCRAIWSVNAVRAVSGCRVRTRGIEAALRDLIAQGSCCIAQPHGQRRTAVSVKRMTSPYVQNLVVLATRGGEGSGGEGGGGQIN